MKTIRIYGASDDLVEIEGDVPGCDEYDVGGPRLVMARFLVGPLDSGTVGLRVFAIYDGCWSFAIGQVGESRPLPGWPIRITQSSDVPYSVQIEIDVPDNFCVCREDVDE